MDEIDPPSVAPSSSGSGKEGEQAHELSDNCMEYMIFVVNSDLERRELLSRLEAVRKSAIQVVKELTARYIWQRDGFNLETITENGLVYLRGITDYGDAVEDEWLITYIIRKVTCYFTDVWARVSDTDGEFLLVEAANVLPKWLSPESDRFRSWIHRGDLLLVPDQRARDVAAHKNGILSLRDAIDFISSEQKSLIQSPSIQSEAFYRLEKYPLQISNSTHYSRTILPRKLAVAIHSVPASVAPAIDAFYLRDEIAMRPLLSQDLIFPPRDLVSVSVLFSKVLFAQLRSQRFETPSRWRNASMNLGGDTKQGQRGRDRDRLEDGMKLACGFEVLARTIGQSDRRCVRELGIIVNDIEEDGEQALPTNKDMESWEENGRDDDEGWMDIDFEEFEKELNKGRSKSESDGQGFGSRHTQADLRKIVSRFEAFLNDDTAGIEGAVVDDMDIDDEDYEETSEDSEVEDRDVSFDEEVFSRMMREIMGITPGNEPPQTVSNGVNHEIKAIGDIEDEEDKQISQLSSQMENELKNHGALRLDESAPRPSRLKAQASVKFQSTETADSGEDGSDQGSDTDVNVDLNLAKNILESFKSQGGMSGPAGNLLALMGLQLPRDEEDEGRDD